jgi:hypothetical protein
MYVFMFSPFPSLSLPDLPLREFLRRVPVDELNVLRAYLVLATI